MSNWGKIAAWGLTVLLAQWLIASSISVAGVHPDFVFVYVVYLGLFFDPLVAMITAFCLGMLQDTFSWNPFGLSALILVIVAYAPHLFRERLVIGSTATQLAFILFFTLGSDLTRSLFYLTVKQQITVEFPTRFALHFVWNTVFWLLLRKAWMSTLTVDRPFARSKSAGGPLKLS